MKNRIIALFMAIVLMASSMAAIAPSAEAARILKSVEGFNSKDIYFADLQTKAGRYYCQLSKAYPALAVGYLGGYGGYTISLRERPTLQLRNVAAWISYSGVPPTKTYYLPTIIGADNIGENSTPILIPPRTQTAVGFSGQLYNDRGREQLYVINESGSFDIGGAVNCPSWEQDPDVGWSFLPATGLRLSTPKAYNNIVNFFRNKGKMPSLEQLKKLIGK